jgi:hypothetical protein
MCRACDGDFPTERDHRTFSDSAAELRRGMRGRADDARFLDQISELDRLRFGGRSPEWGHPITREVTNQLVFGSEHPHALTLFVMTCWFDMQEPYTRVWTDYLRRLSKWIDAETQREDDLKFGRFSEEKARHAWKTWQACQVDGFESWFVKTINRIDKKNQGKNGNFRRFVGRIILDLMEPGSSARKDVIDLANGTHRCVLQKRAWMLAMFLRRDQGIIKCLLEQRVQRIKGGPEALKSWYDGRKFPEAESELPIDGRIEELGPELFDARIMMPSQIASAAHEWGRTHQRAPSVLDALFFAMD